MQSVLFPHFLSFVPGMAIIVALATAVVHIAFAIGVYTSATDLQIKERKLVFVGPVIWTLAVLFGGVLVAVAYWVMHFSTLRGPDA